MKEGYSIKVRIFWSKRSGRGKGVQRIGGDHDDSNSVGWMRVREDLIVI
jgi:hypothetical protein